MQVPAFRATGQNEVPANDQGGRTVYSELCSELRDWFDHETSDWDTLVERGGNQAVSEGCDQDLWGSMPTVDSKAVARTSPIFEKHLGRPLKVRLIRPGGYTSVDDMIGHLVPAMMDIPESRVLRLSKQEEQ